MASYGMLVLGWPLILGVDAGGVVVSSGANAQTKYNLKAGTHVFGCTRCGAREYATCQEYYLMDAALTVPKPDNISIAESATLGGGTYTASLALFHGLKIPLPDTTALPEPESKDEVIVILGGASSVGMAAVQIAYACGYKVISSCSPASADLVRSLHAEPFSYKLSIEDQVKQIQDLAQGKKIRRIFDAVASPKPEIVGELVKASGNASECYFTTTNDWDAINGQDLGGAHLDEIHLGLVGRPDAMEINAAIESYVPVIHELVKSGKIKPSQVVQIGDGKDVWQDAIAAFEYQKSGKAGSKKVIVKIGDE